MYKKTTIAGVVATVIGFFLLALGGEGILPDYFVTFGVLIAIAGIILWSVGESLTNSQSQKYRLLIYPIIGMIFWNLMIVYFFINMDKQLFNDFVSDFGLKGSWNLFTLNMQANINGTLKTYPYSNGTLYLFLMCVIGNIALSAINLARIYRANQKSPILPPPS